MHATLHSPPALRKALWAGRIISGLAVLFMIMDGTMKLANPQPVVDAMTKLGYPTSMSPGIGILALGCVVVYLIPRTALLGAVLLTGYLGGAIASQVRIGAEAFSIVFPVIVAGMFWTGLLLRDERLREVFPLRG